MSLDVEELYRRYGPMVVRRCRSLLGDDELAWEASQEVFVQLLRRRDRLDVHAPSSLLWTTATRVCLNRMRRTRRRPEDADDLVWRIARAPEDEGPTLARLTLARLFADERSSTRVMAVLHLRDGLTLQEVAAETGLSVSGVRRRLGKLREHLHELEDA